MCAKARFSGVDIEPSLLEVGEHLFEDSNMLCPRAFCNMKKAIDVNMQFVYTDEEFRHLLLEDVGTVAQPHWNSLILVHVPLGDNCAKFF